MEHHKPPPRFLTSLIVRVVLLLSGTMLLAGGAVFVTLGSISRRNLTQHVAEETYLRATTLEKALSPALQAGNLSKVQSILRASSHSPRIDLLRVYGPSGRVLASGKSSEIGKRIPEPTVSRVFSGEGPMVVSSRRRFATLESYKAAVSIRAGVLPGVVGSEAVLFIQPDIAFENHESASYIRSVAFLIVGVSVLTALGVCLIIYFWVLGPLKRFADATGEIRKGNYSVRVRLDRSDEFGLYAETFNIMLEEIAANRAALERRSKSLEVEVMETNEKLLQAQKMDAIGRLAGGIAHDFNNVLTGIIGYCDLLLMRVAAEDSNHRFISEIRKAAYRASGLTGQLLAFSRKQSLQPRIFLLNELVSEITPMLQRLMGEEVELSARLEESLWHTLVDPTKIDQVIMNLAVNAHDAMPKGGRFIIETRNVHVDSATADRHPGIAAPGDYVLLAVSDTGSGMSHETVSHIFEPFYTTKEAGHGTGLGLATVYGIVQQAGGFILVYSEEGVGTTFKVYLPRVEQAEQLEEAESLPGEEGSPAAGAEGGISETILVAEDDETIRSLIAMILRDNGYRVYAAADGESAFAVFKNNQSKVDLLLTDVVMPKLDGRQLADRVRTISPDIKVIFTSGYTSEMVLRHGVNESQDILLDKPIGVNELLGAVRSHLDCAHSTR